MSVVNPYLLGRDRSISVFGAHRISGYSCRMLRHLIRIGELPAVRPGKRSWIVKESDLLRTMRRRFLQAKMRKRAALSKLDSFGDGIPSLTTRCDSTIYSTDTISVAAQKAGLGAIPKTKHGGQYENKQEPIEVRQ
jgi:hypothetical protein